MQADVSAGAKLPYLTAIGWSLLGGGSALLVGATLLVVLGVRRPRTRPGGPVPAAGVAPSTA